MDGLEWIRLLYLYPTTIDDAMLDAMAESEKVCKYIDLPLQHASDAVLKRMRRPGTRAGYERLLDRIRTRIPDVALRTTFIVGFPGETEDDVAELSAFVSAVPFDHIGVFTYSHEEGTRAGEWDDDVPAATKRKRRDRLMAQQRDDRRRRAAAPDRQPRVRLVVDGPSPEHELVAPRSSGVAGARNRPRRLPDRLRPDRGCGGPVSRRRGGRCTGLRPRRPPPERLLGCAIIGSSKYVPKGNLSGLRAHFFVLGGLAPHGRVGSHP